MTRSTGKPNSNSLDPAIPDLKKQKVPTIDELMRPPPWWQFLPAPAPSKNNSSPFGPAPTMSPLPPPPLEVDRPSRPPEWLFGPPYISNEPPARNSVPSSVSSAEALPVPSVAAPAQEKRGGLLDMMADAGLIDPSNPTASPAGGLAGLIQDYLRTKSPQLSFALCTETEMASNEAGSRSRAFQFWNGEM
jgi:hypothetical protein